MSDLTPPTSSHERFLVVGPSWVGDMVMAQSLFKVLRQRHPECLIDVIAPGWSEPILARMPEVNETIPLLLGHGQWSLATRWRLGRQLRSRHYTQGLVLPRSWKSALPLLAAGISKRIGFHGEQRYGLLNERRHLDKTRLDQTVKRFVSLGLAEGSDLICPEPQLDVDGDNQQRLIQQLGLAVDRPAIAMMPGAEYGPAKQWPLTHFQQLAESLLEQGYQVWIIGGPKDKAAGETIVSSGHPHLHNLCGLTQLADAVDLLAWAEQAVTNDSGLMHVAAAVGTHIQALYGSSSPKFTPPLTSHATIHWLALDCAPCFKRECPLGHRQCLVDLPVSQVMSAISSSIRSVSL
ncbi:lipopolysaccharide heptosyltransferase II [Terasakiispira papahanaumokuakeensis]|uniref:lipopolysaccharide heptosyltransferase II n=1 Tax=Terasakiispira papahanaumokuakeensis TaxID=197479 RepID=A0A1E2V8J0_9GAMM|nr:lipopolysaccharide heptosyltransferase II [Terasakiispira papahanaumokuakeensis]ODC03156.1 lipopolysaccharide heptosyltransferase II [Terasakiispira papahanaumokuakeensis]